MVGLNLDNGKKFRIQIATIMALPDPLTKTRTFRPGQAARIAAFWDSK